MTLPASDCERCRHFQAVELLLRAEIAGLKALLLDRVRPRSDGSPALEIVGVDQPQRLSIACSPDDGPEFHRVSLTYRNDLSAGCLTADIDAEILVAYFEDLAVHKNGWDGDKCYCSREQQLTISCSYQGSMYRPEVWMQVRYGLDLPSFDPYWTVEMRLEVDPGTLDHVAAQARVCLGRR